MNSLGFLALTVYMKQDLAEVARVLQMLVKQPLGIERFNVHLAPTDVATVKGLERMQEPVIRLAIIGTPRSDNEVESATKALNRLISVFKVVADQY